MYSTSVQISIYTVHRSQCVQYFCANINIYCTQISVCTVLLYKYQYILYTGPVCTVLLCKYQYILYTGLSVYSTSVQILIYTVHRSQCVLYFCANINIYCTQVSVCTVLLCKYQYILYTGLSVYSTSVQILIYTVHRSQCVLYCSLLQHLRLL